MMGRAAAGRGMIEFSGAGPEGLAVNPFGVGIAWPGRAAARPPDRDHRSLNPRAEDNRRPAR